MCEYVSEEKDEIGVLHVNHNVINTYFHMIAFYAWLKLILFVSSL